MASAGRGQVGPHCVNVLFDWSRLVIDYMSSVLINPQIHGQMIFYKGAKTTQWGTNRLQQMVPGNWMSTLKRVEWEPNTIHKN